MANGVNLMSKLIKNEQVLLKKKINFMSFWARKLQIYRFNIYHTYLLNMPTEWSFNFRVDIVWRQRTLCRSLFFPFYVHVSSPPMVYKKLIRAIVFHGDAMTAHDDALWVFLFFSSNRLIWSILVCSEKRAHVHGNNSPISLFRCSTMCSKCIFVNIHLVVLAFGLT